MYCAPSLLLPPHKHIYILCSRVSSQKISKLLEIAMGGSSLCLYEPDSSVQLEDGCPFCKSLLLELSIKGRKKTKYCGGKQFYINPGAAL